ncbi:MAG: hypothetical protein PHX18_01400, partial [Candidatus Gastranaerophilales bacterium]|nr:hypothetical protein [Candidatus Gastranaerophilales bacterium]
MSKYKHNKLKYCAILSAVALGLGFTTQSALAVDNWNDLKNGILNNETVSLDLDITAADTLTTTSSTDATLNGNGYTLSGTTTNYRLFSNYGNLNFNNIKLTNSGSIENKSSGTLTINNTTFGKRTGSGTVEDPYVYSDGNKLTNGGAIYNDNGTVNIASSNFYANSATNSGGAIYNIGSMTITDSAFAANASLIGGLGRGGAIYNASALTINGNSVFGGNIASNFGGAIYNDNGTISITDGEFYNNKTTGVNKDGGAIYNTGATSGLTISNSIFGKRTGSGTTEDPYVYSDGNETTRNGGAIFNNNTAVATITITDSQFYGNKANDGAAIYTLGPLTINGNSIFAGNEASNSGGAIYNDNGTISITDGEFYNNKTTGVNKDGGAIYNTGATSGLTISNSIFGKRTGSGTTEDPYVYSDGNETTRNGGAIFNNNTAVATITITDSQFYGNKANDGAAIYTLGPLTINGNSIFAGNEASNSGGAIYNRSNLTVNGSVFTSNTATGSGGAIYNDSGILSLTGAEFYNNKATAASKNGGAIYNTGETSGLTITNSIFGKRTGSGTTEDPYVYSDGNETTRRGGAINNNNAASFTITNSQFYGNKANDGGAIYNASGPLTINGNSVFAGNTATNVGGAVYTAGALTINDNAIFRDNISNNTAGAFYNAAAEVSITGAEFYNNQALAGGAIYNWGHTAKLTVENSIFGKRTGSGTTEDPYVYSDGNIATTSQGGAIFNSTNSEATIINSRFYGNSANNAGAVYNVGILTIRDNSVFDNNTSPAGAGAIYSSGILSISDTKFYNNKTTSAVANGGAVYVTGATSEAVISNSIFGSRSGSGTVEDPYVYSNGNQAGSGGGALCFQSNTTANTISGSKFYGNTATNGAAIYNQGILTIKGNSIFAGNTAATKGGAIYNAGTLNLIADSGNIEFTDNKANSVSNAIHTNGGTVNISADSDKSVIFNDRITSENATSIININNNATYNTGSIILNADMAGYLGAVNLFGGTLKLANSGTFFGAPATGINFAMSGASVLDLQNSKIDSIKFIGFTAADTPALKIDISPNTLTLDNLAITTGSGSIATNFNILNDLEILTPVELTVLSSVNNGISLSDFEDIIINTTDSMYRIKHSDNIGKILFATEIPDGLKAALMAAGTRSYAQTDEYLAYMNLPAMNKGTLNISGTGILNGNDAYSLFAVDSTSSADTWNLNINDVTIKNWTAVDGGALNIKGENSTVVIDNVTFDNNIATNVSGGAIYNDGGKLTITDSNFYKNTALGDTNQQGGAIYNTGATALLNISNSTFGKRTGAGTVEDPYVYSDGNE